MVLYGINGNINVVGGAIMVRHCMLAECCYMALTAIYIVHVVGGPIVVRHCMMAGWCYMVLTAMYMHLVDR